MDAAKIQRELGWAPRETFESGLRRTVRWYLETAIGGSACDGAIAASGWG